MIRKVALTLSMMIAVVGVSCTESESGLDGAKEGAAAAGAGDDGFGAMDPGDGNGDCVNCTEQATGVGTNDPFDPTSNDSSGVGLDDDGALVLDASQSDIPGIIWIANTGQNSVSKIDTTTFEELGRYRIASNDPSRTSVNSLGDVFVANRAGNSLTKVSAAGQDCPDTNGDQQITTSSGAGDLLAVGQDDCVLWNVPVPNAPHLRGVAAQDVVVPDPVPDDPQATTIERYVWAGGTSHHTVYKFDGDTGDLLIQTESPTKIYGLALDGQGQLWMAGRGEQALGRVDTTKCFDQASCDAAVVCHRTCTTYGCTCEAGCPTSCDNATKERIQLQHGVYGITVDYLQRVWLGGDRVRRYNPLAPDATRLDVVNVGSFIHGIAADAAGSVWGASGGGVIRLDGDSLDFTTVPVPGSKGMAVDKDGKIWAVERGAYAHVIEPGGGGLDDYTTQNHAVGGLVDCYTYSDMTGQQLALATNDPGYYREVFEGCSGEETRWVGLAWDVDRPPSTQVRFKVRSAASVAALENETFMLVANLPPAESPADLEEVFDSNSRTMGRYLEVEVVLQGHVDLNGLVSPKVNSFGVTHECPPQAF